MTGEPEAHPEVFTTSTPWAEEGTRTVYPPTPDADGKFDFCAVWDWTMLMDQVHQTIMHICALLRYEITTAQGHTADRLRGCLYVFETIRPLFLLRDLSL